MLDRFGFTALLLGIEDRKNLQDEVVDLISRCLPFVSSVAIEMCHPADKIRRLPVMQASLAMASPIGPNQTYVLPRSAIKFEPWIGLPARSGTMAKRYGDINEPGPYLLLMRWHPGWFSRRPSGSLCSIATELERRGIHWICS
jgi:hypothetical protein